MHSFGVTSDTTMEGCITVITTGNLGTMAICLEIQAIHSSVKFDALGTRKVVEESSKMSYKKRYSILSRGD